MRLLITNAQVIDPFGGYEGAAAILIENGIIKAVAKNGKIKNHDGAQVIDAAGMYVAPAFTDMHTHLREPGFEHKETIRTGTFAALKGGFATVCCMPNTNPVNDNPGTTEYILKKAAGEGSARVLPIGAITKGQKGEELAEMDMMLKAGCIAFSDDGRPVESPIIMRRALEYAKGLDTTVISHAEDLQLSSGGVMNEGLLSMTLGLKGSPSIAEEVMVFRDIALCGITGGKLHIAHVSTKGSVDIIRRAKEQGIHVTAETCPHYFSITEDAVTGYNTNAKVNPPLRRQEDVEAIKDGLRDGIIDVIATDHAPHGKEEKTREFDAAPSGISGLETVLPLGLALVRGGTLSMMELIRKLTANPARILGIEAGGISEGREARICIFHPEKEYEFKAGEMLSKGKNSPFDGWKLKGKTAWTILGEKVHEWA